MNEEVFKQVVIDVVKDLENENELTRCIVYNSTRDNYYIVKYNKANGQVLINPDEEVILLEIDYQAGKTYDNADFNKLDTQMFERYSSFRRLNRHRKEIEEYAKICIKKFSEDNNKRYEIFLDILEHGVVMYVGEDEYANKNAILLYKIDENTNKNFNWYNVLLFNNLVDAINIK